MAEQPTQRTLTAARTEAVDLRALARTGPIHFVGIAGAGVSALAELVLHSGGRVTGCDLRPGALGERLAEAGAEVWTGHDPAHVEHALAVVTTAAVPTDHPELVAARRRGIPVLKRATALGALVNQQHVVAIAGTHGKTTTTAMTTAILDEAGLDPTGFVGGRVADWGGGLRPGAGRIVVVEADEYDRSFLTLRPNIAVVTSVEADHLDTYGTVEAIEDAFREFLAHVSPSGRIIACVDDPGASRLLAATAPGRGLGYGLGRHAALRALPLDAPGRASRFIVEDRGEALGEVTMAVPGLHNVRNALAALAAAREAGADFAATRRALASFRGVARRFQEVGHARGVLVFDDYAHHPTEIEATLAAARAAFPERRLVAVFQPHLYTRTRDFADALGRALAAADVAWITDVFPARETAIAGVSGELVSRAAERAGGAQVHYHPGLDLLADALAASLAPGDVCVTLGAGNIDETARALLSRLEHDD